MKRRYYLGIFFIYISIGLTCSVFAESLELEVESNIAEVVVYPDFALITRGAAIKLKTGDYQIIFPDIIEEIDENSLRVSASGDAGVKLFGAQLKREFLEEVPSERIERLEQEIQRLGGELKASQNLKSLLLGQRDFLESIRLFSRNQVPKDLITKMPAPEDLKAILKFLDTELRGNYSEVAETESSIREQQEKLRVLNRQLNQIRGPVKKLKRSIIVELLVRKSGNLNLFISYLARGARWQPIYEARADFEKNQVELVSYGVVKQKTGEDWQGVEISLSTAKPAVGARMPYISSWILRPYQPYHLDKERKGVKISKAIPSLQYEAFAPLEEKKDEGLSGGLGYAKVEQKCIAVVYKLPRRATVKSDGSEHKLAISLQVLPAEFEYSTYPRVSDFAYLGSRVTGNDELQLLAGRVNVFLEGDFIGSSSIGNVAAGEEFDLYLGVDENVTIKRECLEKKVDETLIAGIASLTRRITFKYKLTVENYKSKKIKVNLFEAMPVSQDERIKVKIKDISRQPDKKDWKDRRGICLWELELEPKAKQEILYTLIIEHPRQMQVEGL